MAAKMDEMTAEEKTDDDLEPKTEEGGTVITTEEQMDQGQDGGEQTGEGEDEIQDEYSNPFQCTSPTGPSPRKRKPLTGGGVDPKRAKEDAIGYVNRPNEDGVLGFCALLESQQPTTRICAKNLPDDVKVEKLRQVFDDAENIALLDERSSSGRCALIEWNTVEAAEAAMHKQLTFSMGGRKISLTYCVIQNKVGEDEGDRPESNWLRIEPMPVDITPDQVRELFPTANIFKISLQTFNETSRRVVLSFSSVEEAKKIMEENQGKEYFGNQVKIVYALKLSDPRPKLYVGNLPWNGTEADLNPIFPGNTKIKIVKCRQDKGLWVSNRYALICFKSLADVRKFAEEKHGYELKGHSLDVLTKNKEALWPGIKEVLRHESSKRTLIVQGLPKYATKDDLRTLFPGFISWKIPKNKDMHGNSNQGVAELEYKTQTEVNTYVAEKQGTRLGNVNLWLCSKMDTMKGKNIGLSNRLSLVGFPFGTTDGTIKKAFDGVKKIANRGQGVVPFHPNEVGCVIEFETPEFAKAALDKKQGMSIHGGKVKLYNWGPVTNRVKRFVHPLDPTHRVLVMDIPLETTDEMLKESFPGSRKGCILRDVCTKEPWGAGYVEFSSVEEAQATVEANKEIEILGKKVFPEVVLRLRDSIPLEYTLTQLPDTANEKKLLDYLKGAVEAKILGIDRFSNKFAYVRFENGEDAREAYKNRTKLSLDGKHFIFNFRLEEPELNVRRSGHGRGRGRVGGRGRGQQSFHVDTIGRGGLYPKGRGSFERGPPRGNSDFRGRRDYDRRGAMGYSPKERGGKNYHLWEPDFVEREDFSSRRRGGFGPGRGGMSNEYQGRERPWADRNSYGNDIHAPMQRGWNRDEYDDYGGGRYYGSRRDAYFPDEYYQQEDRYGQADGYMHGPRGRGHYGGGYGGPPRRGSFIRGPERQYHEYGPREFYHGERNPADELDGAQAKAMIKDLVSALGQIANKGY